MKLDTPRRGREKKGFPLLEKGGVIIMRGGGVPREAD